MSLKTRALFVTLVMLTALLAIDVRGADAQGRLSSGRVMYLEWVELLPRAEREGFVPGPPPPNHGYLDGIGGKSFGRSGQQKRDPACLGVGERFNPDCESTSQANMSAAVNEELDGKVVRLQGYIVPLEVAPNGKVIEFFLASYVGACIHVPPPPPNQMIYAKVPARNGLGSMYDAYAVTGVLRTHGKVVGLGGSAYTMDVQFVERLR